MAATVQLTIEQIEAVRGRMPPEHLARFDALVENRLHVQSLPEFIREASPHLPPPAHIMPIVELCHQARHKRIRATVSMPPRHAKSTTLLHAFAWWLKCDPADTCAYFTYSDRQGRSKSRLAFRLARDAGVDMDPSSRDMGEWRTLEGGGLLAGGAGGGLTGHGVSGLFVIDDPYKNRTDADSSVIRERIWEWFTEVALTRLEGASVIVVHTRWHTDDIIGRLLENPKWININLPAIAEPDDPIGRETGEALWPSRFPIEYLKEMRDSQIGEFSFASLFQGQPRPRGASVFHEPARFDLSEWKPDGHRVVIAVDPAASTKTSADYSVAAVIAARGYGPEMKAWLIHLVRVQEAIPTFVDRLVALQAKFWGATLAIESVGAFKCIPQMLRQINPSLRIMEINPQGDKFTRAQPLSAAWNGGRFLVPLKAPWITDYLREMNDFTGVNDARDDQPDATAHGWNTLQLHRPTRRGSVIATNPFG